MATHELTSEEEGAYNAPFPSIIYKAAVRTFPSILATIEDQNNRAWQALGEYMKSFLFFGGERDYNMGRMENQQRMTNHIPGVQGQEHERFEDAGHFIQEDIGSVLAAKVVAFMQQGWL
jgi:haloalkane dehalogenase